MKLRIVGVIIVLFILFSHMAVSQERLGEKGLIQLEVKERLQDDERLQILQDKLAEETDPVKKEAIRKEIKTVIQNMLQDSRQTTLEIQTERERITEFMKKNIRLVDKERVDQAEEDYKLLQIKIKELNQAESEEEKAKILKEIKVIKERINKTMPRIKEEITRFKEITARKEQIKEVAEKIRDANKRKILERLKQKDMIKINKARKFMNILDRETMKETRKTLMTLSFKAERKMFDVDIVEDIPKSFAEDISKIEFSIEPEVLEDDPIVKWNFDSIDQGEEVEVSYWVEGEQEDNTTTIAAEEPYEEKKLNQLIIFVAIACVVFIILALFMVGREGSSLKKKRKKKK